MTEPAKSNVELTKLIIELVNKGDYDTLDQYLHDNMALDVPYGTAGIPPFTYGGDKIRAAFRMFPLIFKRFKLTILDIYDCPATNAVVYELESDGEIATGDPYSNRYLNMLVFLNGQVIVWREMFNPEKMREDRRPLLAT